MNRIRICLKMVQVFSALALLAGCSGTVQDFVAGVNRPGDDGAPGDGINAPSTQLKVSPGHIEANGSSVGARLTITAKNRQLKGNQVGAQVSLSTSRQQ